MVKQDKIETNSLTNKITSAIGLRVIFYNKDTVGSLLNKSIKSKTPTLLQRSKVDKIVSCEKLRQIAYYISKTKRKLHKSSACVSIGLL